MPVFLASVVDVAGRSDWQSPLYAALAPLALWRTGSRRGAGLLWSYVVYLFLTWWLLTHRLDRFWLPTLPALAVLAGLGADWVRSRAWSLLLAVLLAVDPRAPLALIDRIDGLLLIGGADLDPATYGADRQPATESVYPARDAFEIAMLRGSTSSIDEQPPFEHDIGGDGNRRLGSSRLPLGIHAQIHEEERKNDEMPRVSESCHDASS